MILVSISFLCGLEFRVIQIQSIHHLMVFYRGVGIGLSAKPFV
jgi:hypothetical protein